MTFILPGFTFRNPNFGVDIFLIGFGFDVAIFVLFMSTLKRNPSERPLCMFLFFSAFILSISLSWRFISYWVGVSSYPFLNASARIIFSTFGVAWATKATVGLARLGHYKTIIGIWFVVLVFLLPVVIRLSRYLGGVALYG